MIADDKATCPFLTTKESIPPVEQLLLEKRRLFLYGEINPESAVTVIKNIKYLNYLTTEEPILLEIYSGGGSVSAGFAIINAIKQSQARVITAIAGVAASMAGLISVSGDVRTVYPHAWWMAHDMSGGISGDYSKKVEYRSEWVKESWKQIEAHLKNHTKLNKKDLEIARNGELWLTYKQCCDKKIADYCIMKTADNAVKAMKPKTSKKGKK